MLRLALRLTARAGPAGPSNARLATPIVASGLSKSYRTKADGSTVPKKQKKKSEPIDKKAEEEAAAKKAYKLLSTEEKAAISLKAKQAQIKEKIKLLKAQALAPPKYRKLNDWAVDVKDNVKDKAQGAPIASVMKALGDDYKNLSSSQREHYTHLATEANAKSLREFEEWLNGHTPAQILAANAARAQLRSKLADSRTQYPPIKDDRLVKRAPTAYLIFYGERISSGDFHSVKAGDAAKTIGVEYNALPASERKKYQDLADKETERYARQYQEVYGIERPAPRRSTRTDPST